MVFFKTASCDLINKLFLFTLYQKFVASSRVWNVLCHMYVHVISVVNNITNLKLIYYFNVCLSVRVWVIVCVCVCVLCMCMCVCASDLVHKIMFTDYVLQLTTMQKKLSDAHTYFVNLYFPLSMIRTLFSKFSLLCNASYTNTNI